MVQANCRVQFTAEDIEFILDVLRPKVNSRDCLIELLADEESRDMILDIPEMIAVASSAATLYPGDLIASGTPAGVGPIRPGDRLEMEIEGVGRLELPVVAGEAGGSPVFDTPYDFRKATA